MRIVVTGSECTGKSTLARTIAAELGWALVPEESRRYAESIGRALTREDVEPIARATIAAIDAAPTHAILDTDLISTIVYARHYYGACPPWIVDAALDRRATLYLLCHTDVPWVADGVRDRPEARSRLHLDFAVTLEAVNAHVVDIIGDWETRDATARAAVRAARAG
ncbi:MAG: ATP-binding protein [Gemmatimonadaceae bacterium]|nr:ATP-binding protein [Gemmatimonadaceae bacterium]